MTGFEGGCLCAQVRYRVDAEPVAALACHCRDSQYVSGGAEANVVVVPSGTLSLKSGKQRVYRSITSGTEVACLLPELRHTSLRRQRQHPEMTAVKVGTLDDPASFKRQGHMWMASASPRTRGPNHAEESRGFLIA
jgi:hypothetical protein